MRKQLLLIMMALMPMIGYANIFRANIDGMIYSLDTNEKTADLLEGSSFSGHVKIPSTVVYGETSYDVVSISYKVFKDCTELTSVSIPSSIRNIGTEAFKNCVNLTAVYITDLESWCKIEFGNSSSSNPLAFAHHLYLNGEEVTNLVIPDGIEIVEARSFTGCDLKSVSIPASVTNIGYSAFSNCTKLTSVSIPNSVEYINGKAFAGCSALLSIDIPEGVEGIGQEAFKECTGLTSVTIGDDVTHIGSSAFEGCSNLATLEFGRSLTNISSNAFKGCASLSSIDLPLGVSEIGSGAFDGCSSVTQLTIPSGVRNITSLSFANCVSLKKVCCYIEGVPSTADDAFKNSNQENATLYVSETSLNEYKMISPWSKFGSISELTGNQENDNSGTCGENLTWTFDEDTKALTISGTGEMDNFGLTDSPWYEINKSIQSVVIEPGVTTIGRDAFIECTELVSVSIPNSVTTIGAEAFRNCGLTSLTIPNSVISIGQSAFLGCSGLTSILIPNSVTEIWHYAFCFCSNVTTLTIGSNVKRIASCALFMSGLTDIYCYAEDTPEAMWAFQDDDEIPKEIVQSATLHVPASSLNAYKSTKPWSNFKEIVALDASGIKSIDADNRIIQINSIRGEKLETPSKGINIIKMKDGTIKKVLIK